MIKRQKSRLYGTGKKIEQSQQSIKKDEGEFDDKS